MRSEASAALLRGCDNYLVMHNVACIYGLISQSAKEDKLKHENLVLGALKRAVAIGEKAVRQRPKQSTSVARHSHSWTRSVHAASSSSSSKSWSCKSFCEPGSRRGAGGART